MRISRPSCANSRIPPRHRRPPPSASLPPPPSFAVLFLTSPADQCTPAGAADNGVRSSQTSTPRTALSRSFLTTRTAEGPVALTSSRAEGHAHPSTGSSTALSVVASHPAAHNRRKNTYHTRHSPRILPLSFPPLSTGHHYHPPMHHSPPPHAPPSVRPLPFSILHVLPFTGPKPVNVRHTTERPVARIRTD